MSCRMRGPWCLVAVLSVGFFTFSNYQALAINLPAAGINATGYAYFGTALPFVDVSHMDASWHSSQMSASNATVPHEIPLTSDGYPALLAPGETARSLIFTQNGGIYPLGVYTLRWAGNGQVQLTSPGLTVLNSGPGQITYKLTSTNTNGIILEVTKTDPTNPLRNISVRAPFAGATDSAFNPSYKNDLANYGVIRYMGWNSVNNSKVSKWSDRAEPIDFHWGTAAGVPYELQVQLSNETKEDLWLTVPHLADDNYVRNLAYLVNQKLSPGLRVWVEYSNEVWNGGFEQSRYANQVLMPRYGVPNAAQAYGRRSAEIFDIFSSQITDPKRLVRVIAGQNANYGVLDQSLVGATVNGTVKADVAAVAPYFTVDTDKLYQQYLSGQVDIDAVFAELRSSIDTIIKSAEKNRDIAAARGLPLVGYEGGQHIVARPGEQHNDKSFVDLLTALNRDPRMGDLYTYMLDKWYDAGGKTFVFAGETAPAMKWGDWGLKESYLDNDAVKFRAVQDYLKALPHDKADFNKDGAVDLQDYEIWRSSFDSHISLSADANGDGKVNAADFVTWRKQLSQSSELSFTAAPVPEPSALFLVAEAACVSLLEFNKVRFLAGLGGRAS